MSLTTASPVTLEERYDPGARRVYLNGTQALVRLLILQRVRDAEAGLDTAGFVSGYRGSPLGGLDRELWRAKRSLERHRIHFWPGINEDLAATAVWGTQMLEARREDARHDGVFAMWYGKGAGLDRCGDVMRHAHGAGTSPHGGVLAVVGDDHAQKSSTHPYASEPTFADLLMPVLYPANVAEIIEYGLLGWAMSRFSGAWVGLKTLAETLDCSTSLVSDATQPLIVTPDAPGGLHFRWPDAWPNWEARTVGHKLDAVLAFARANRINRVTLEPGPAARLGIIASGKAYGDLRQAMRDLDLGDEEAAGFGLRLCKLGMPWPLDQDGIRRFAEGLDEILVIEEKRPWIETGVKEALYDLAARPLVTGKRDAAGGTQFPWIGEITPDLVVQALVPRLAKLGRAAPRGAVLARQARLLGEPRPQAARPPYFCSGCPHSRSTKVPDGSRAIAGVGCHYMAVGMDRATETFSQMGGEGATWIGQAPFSNTPHVFVNLGEGTYFHSGSLAVRACIAAGVNITYKLLFNDAVAMTGGQPVDGQLSVAQLTRQLSAEGIREIRIVAEEPERHRGGADPLADGVVVHPRDALDAVQRELRALPGVTALIYDQACAAEKRRRRKRGALPDPPRHVVINEGVCEGCGDCGRASNCLSVVPVETEHGRKRRIDHASCNKDLSCLEGFCPSFVTVAGGTLRRRAVTPAAPPPEPGVPALDRPWGIFITGIGGTGVVTIGALLGMAAHLEGKGCTILDQMGMAQKGGAVVTHVRLLPAGEEAHSVRVPSAGADLLLACDIVVAMTDEAIRRIEPGRTRIVVNTYEAVTGAFTRDPDATQPTPAMLAALRRAAGADRVEALDATRLAEGLTGDAIGTNLFLLGYAWQRGQVPLSRAAIERAIELNGVAVKANKATFLWGRQAAADLAAVEAAAGGAPAPPQGDMTARRAAFLTAYQNAAYAARFRAAVDAAHNAEAMRTPGMQGFAESVSRGLFKLMAYKDEYEVARLHIENAFLDGLRETFEGDWRLRFHVAPPLLARRDPVTGLPRKRAFGGWVLPLFRILARLRWLRGTPFDPFGWTAERRTERQLILEYEGLVRRLAGALAPENHATAVALAALPDRIRGFGHVKARNLAEARQRQAELLARFADGAPAAPALAQAAAE